MGLLGLFKKKKPKKNFATLEDVKEPQEDVQVSDKPLKRSEIGEIDAGAEEASSEASDASSSEASATSMFDMGAEDSVAEASDDMGSEDGTLLKLEEAMKEARKYLIVHAQIPNNLLPKKSSKRENGTFYFEFQDRDLNRIELDGKGEVIDWEREKL